MKKRAESEQIKCVYFLEITIVKIHGMNDDLAAGD